MNDETTIINKIRLPRKTRFAVSSPAKSWQPAHAGHRLLYDGLDGFGASVESHDVGPGIPFAWTGEFQDDCLHLCLNLAGRGTIRWGGNTMEFDPLTAGFCITGKLALEARRESGETHRFIIVRLPISFLRARLGACDGALHPLVEKALERGARTRGLGEVHRLNADQERRAADLLAPPTFQAARGLWYQSKVLELMVEYLFERRDESELFCDRQRRLARERVEKVIAILRRCLADPPILADIGREAGCSPFYLSRTFSQEMGMTIPQYLRKLRMERAGELLRSGKYNVTEAALEVGYSSLSHFSQAFCQTMGCCPGFYHLKRNG